MADITVAINILIVIAAVSIDRVPDIVPSAHWHLVFECPRHVVGTADGHFVGLANDSQHVPLTCNRSYASVCFLLVVVLQPCGHPGPSPGYLTVKGRVLCMYLFPSSSLCRLEAVRSLFGAFWEDCLKRGLSFEAVRCRDQSVRGDDHWSSSAGLATITWWLLPTLTLSKAVPDRIVVYSPFVSY